MGDIVTKTLQSKLVCNYNVDNLSNYKLNIVTSGTYHLTYCYDKCFDKNVSININDNLDVVIIEYHQLNGDEDKKGFINVSLNVKANSKLKIISYSYKDELELNYKSEINMFSNSSLETYYAFLGGNSISNHQINLIETGASVKSNLRVFIDQDYIHKHDIYINHLDSNTFSNMINYAVLDDESTININASSYINSGCRKSEAYQKSRIFALSEQIKSNINPILKIHENDVKASHAATSGKINYLDLYYMKSRGLDLKEINKLLTLGLLLKDVDEKFMNELAFIIERRLGNV